MDSGLDATHRPGMTRWPATNKAKEPRPALENRPSIRLGPRIRSRDDLAEQPDEFTPLTWIERFQHGFFTGDEAADDRGVDALSGIAQVQNAPAAVGDIDLARNQP